MGALTGITVGALGGIRWVLLALASGAVWLAAEAKRAADRLRR